MPCIYKHRDTITAASGATSSASLNIRGGLCRQIIVRANTDTTVFRANLVDENSVTVLDYPYHEGEINDWDITLPIAGEHTLNITNASVDDTFTILLQVQE